MRKKAERIPAEISSRFAQVVAAFAGDQQVGQGKMFSSDAVLNVNGKIFAMEVKGKLVVKLPRHRVEELIAMGKGRNFDPGHGRLMKEWAEVEAPPVEWIELAKEAYHFVVTGKPKASPPGRRPG